MLSSRFRIGKESLGGEWLAGVRLSVTLIMDSSVLETERTKVNEVCYYLGEDEQEVLDLVESFDKWGTWMLEEKESFGNFGKIWRRYICLAGGDEEVEEGAGREPLMVVGMGT
ncbi:hypothetical protein BDZ91DRAFT_761362 [Kalaharituber pfeilii]|nr:hypothetical protein BDZ91DRAFT_761362 [Kalaharituber pfeilii]